jgi:hydrogenase maturation protein HypF
MRTHDRTGGDTRRVRRAAVARGIVQGVGFRPAVARTAATLALGGRVRNVLGGVHIEVEGPARSVDAFEARLRAVLPAAARLEALEWRDAETTGETAFTIDASDDGAPTTPGITGERADARAPAAPRSAALVLACDIATCGECVREVLEGPPRRRGDPFASCAHCGPRYTICEALPWDRSRTSMRHFPRCAACEAEYHDARDRRFHAEASVCRLCGPTLRAHAPGSEAGFGPLLGQGDAAIDAAVECMRRGGIVAVLGIGGFQLWADARDERAVAELRRRKRRPREPFAVLVAELDEARLIARPTAAEEAALTHAAAPIVLLERADDACATGPRLAPSVAPGRRRIGVMLPAAPLLHLLARRLGGPAVVTSANVHGSPIARTERELLAHGPSSDCVLTHDRPVVARIDDSLVHVVAGRMRVLRRGRGLAPHRIALDVPPARLVAYGAHLRCAPALLDGKHALLLPHVGDLDAPAARDALGEVVDHALQLVGHEAEAGVVDAHPDLGGTRVGLSRHARVIGVHHHHAHVASVLAEHGEPSALGLAWDGTGLGTDGTAWGGEALAVDAMGARRIARLRPFPLPGGDAAARDGLRVLAGLLYAAGASPPRWLQTSDRADFERFTAVASRPALAPQTTSVGRLLDGVAALLGVRRHVGYEGEAAMDLEDIATADAAPYPLPVDDQGIVDWRPMLQALLDDPGDPDRAASRVHASLVALAVSLAERGDARRVALSGGCFANRILAEGATAGLLERGIAVLLPEQVPPGDGGLSLGQLWVGAHALGRP